VDDLEAPWTFDYKFDFIFYRMMVGAFADVPRFIEQSFENLNSGGWIEMEGLCFPIQCDDSTLADDAPLRKW